MSLGSEEAILPKAEQMSWGLGGLQGLKLEEFENLIAARSQLGENQEVFAFSAGFQSMVHGWLAEGCFTLSYEKPSNETSIDWPGSSAFQVGIWVFPKIMVPPNHQF